MSDMIGLHVPKKSIGTVLDDICKKHLKPVFSGASSRGWSRYSRLQRCPKLYKLSYISPPKRSAFEIEHSDSLEIGTAFHAFLSMRYSHLWWTPQELLDMLLDSPCEASFVAEAWRLYEAYALNYENDYIQPLGVEITGKDPETGNSCRYDLLVKIKTDITAKQAQQHGLIPGGTYIFEHKTTKAIYADVLDGWDMDGEIRGEVALWDRDLTLEQRYGKLCGLVINVVSRAKRPEMRRILVAPSTLATKQHLKALEDWTEIEQFYTNQNIWPPASNGCVSKYGRCEFFNYCRTGGE